MKRIVTLTVLTVLLLSLTACGLLKETTYIEDNISITLPAGFWEQEESDFDAMYMSLNYFVAYQTESFEDYREAGVDPAKVSQEQYAEVSFSSLDSAVEPYTSDGMTCTEYTAETEEGTSRYLVVARKLEGAFVTAQFGCTEDRFEELKPEFLACAKTLTYTNED
ncbi:MAG: hypothetical protein IJP27_08020 [Clostridia bacterium]|nr:hypothetical protein [Clostridia bacterium]